MEINDGLTTEIFGQKISCDLSTRIIDLAGIKAPLVPINIALKKNTI
jgi:hypothetical protein